MVIDKSKPQIFKLMSPLGLGSVIHVDFIKKTVSVENFTDQIPLTAFGVIDNPTWERFEYFLKSRCFPETRDYKELILKEMGIDRWDPILIISKTQGRMLHDNLWLEVEEDAT